MGALTGLTYPQSTLVYVHNQAIAPTTPILSGGVSARFSVNPALPSGLQIDGATGIISGTPTAVVAAQNYTVSATNDAGAEDAVLNIRVAEAPPALVFAGAPFTFVDGEQARTNAPDNLGGPIASCVCSVLGPLGFSVDTHTCEVSGFAQLGVTAAGVDYPLTISYFDGAVTQTLTQTVNITIAPPLSLYPPTITLPAVSGLTQTFAGQGGQPPYVYTLSTLSTDTIDLQSGDYLASGDTGESIVQVTDVRGRTATSTISSRRNWANGPVHAISSNLNQLFFGGGFSRVGFFAAPSMIALSASSADPINSFDLQNGFDGPVSAIVMNGDDVYVGGTFARYRDQQARGLAKISLSTGALDTTFTQTLGAANGQVKALALNPAGTLLYVAGSFNQYRGKNLGFESTIAVSTKNGGQKAIFSLGEDSESNPNVTAVAVAPDGIFWAGFFGNGVYGVKKTGFDGTKQFLGTVTTTAKPGINALAYDGQSLYMGGDFAASDTCQYTGGGGSVSCNYIVKLDGKTGAPAAFTGPAALTPFAGGDAVTALAATPDAVWAAGAFANGVLKLDPNNGSVTADGINTAGVSVANAGQAATSLLLNGPTLYVGGGFSSLVSSAAAIGLAALDPDSGDPLPGFAPGTGFDLADVTTQAITGTPAQVLALASDGSTLLCGGSFGAYRGIVSGNVGNFTFSPPAFNSTFASAIAFYDNPDGSVTHNGDEVLTIAGNFGNGVGIVYAGGNFKWPYGAVAQINYNLPVPAFTSTAFNAVGDPVGQVNAILVPPPPIQNDPIWIGGHFTSTRGGGAFTNLLPLSAVDGTAQNSPLSFAGGTVGVTNFYIDSGLGASPDHLVVLGDFTSYIHGSTFTGLTGVLRIDPASAVYTAPAPVTSEFQYPALLSTGPGAAVARVGFNLLLTADPLQNKALDLVVIAGDFQQADDVVAFSGNTPVPASRSGLAQFAFQVTTPSVPPLLRSTVIPGAPADPSIDSGTIYDMDRFVQHDDSVELYVAGNFTQIDGQPAGGLAAFAIPNPVIREGDSGFGVQHGYAFDAPLSRQLQLDGPAYTVRAANGFIYVGGAFHTFQGGRVYGIFAFDGTTGARAD